MTEISVEAVSTFSAFHAKLGGMSGPDRREFPEALDQVQRKPSCQGQSADWSR
jgi:hypothetical protein